MARVACTEQPTPPRIAALAPALADDALPAICFQQVAEGIVAAYSPAQMDRPTAWQIMLDLFGNLRDVTPDWVVTA
ncbi:hypothetical protein [Kitasatospora kifunensis]|uniref:Uncharacterized protein n=1 Tax=Kitasatospora kifunensis TaxID=58351 RepID=A0A7W7QYM5_KITKI|nr:hypothetical protein [Kitasatospora kifunensis]MBB4922222.1 hypothetical protein [Kitasatospora kifunensis]